MSVFVNSQQNLEDWQRRNQCFPSSPQQIALAYSGYMPGTDYCNQALLARPFFAESLVIYLQAQFVQGRPLKLCSLEVLQCLTPLPRVQMEAHSLPNRTNVRANVPKSKGEKGIPRFSFALDNREFSCCLYLFGIYESIGQHETCRPQYLNSRFGCEV